MSFHLKGIQFNGTDKSLLNSTSQSIGIANAWTVSCWFKTPSSNPTGNATIFEIRPPSFATQSAIRCYSGLGSWTGNTIYIYNDSGTTRTVTFNLSTSTLYNIVIYWDGTTLSVKVNNGTAITDTTGAMTMSDYNRQVSIAANVQAQGGPSAIICSSLLVWNTALSTSAITDLYASGNGYDIDVRNSYGNYTATANLKHQWLLGESSDFSVSPDYVSSGGINIYTNKINVVSGDIVTFGSGIPSASVNSNFFNLF